MTLLMRVKRVNVKRIRRWVADDEHETIVWKVFLEHTDQGCYTVSYSLRVMLPMTERVLTEDAQERYVIGEATADALTP